MRIAAAALGASILFYLPGPAMAQSNDEILRRLDALEKQNAALRDRVKQLEGGRRPIIAHNVHDTPAAAAPERAAATPNFTADTNAPFSWSGPHVGGFSGINSWNPTFLLADQFPSQNQYYPMAQGSAAFGGIYGVGGGYDWQRDSLVIGVEGDIAGAFRGRAVSVIAASGSGQFPFVSDKTEAIATVRARAGLALDRTLVYVTAGFATIETKSTAFNSYYSCCAVLSSFSWAPALALGGGLEYALDNHWTVGGEGLYLLAATNRNSATYLVPGAGVVTTTYGTSPSQALAKAGVNYKF